MYLGFPVSAVCRFTSPAYILTRCLSTTARRALGAAVVAVRRQSIRQPEPLRRNLPTRWVQMHERHELDGPGTTAEGR